MLRRMPRSGALRAAATTQIPAHRVGPRCSIANRSSASPFLLQTRQGQQTSNPGNPDSAMQQTRRLACSASPSRLQGRIAAGPAARSQRLGLPPAAPAVLLRRRAARLGSIAQGQQADPAPDFVLVPWDVEHETWWVIGLTCAAMPQGGRRSHTLAGPFLLPGLHCWAHCCALLCRDQEAEARMNALIARFKSADLDGCAVIGGPLRLGLYCAASAGTGDTGACLADGAAVIAVSSAPHPPAAPLHHFTSVSIDALLPRCHAAGCPQRSNGVIDREELRRLLERVGDGEDEVSMVGRPPATRQLPDSRPTAARQLARGVARPGRVHLPPRSPAPLPLLSAAAPECLAAALCAAALAD